MSREHSFWGKGGREHTTPRGAASHDASTSRLQREPPQLRVLRARRPAVALELRGAFPAPGVGAEGRAREPREEEVATRVGGAKSLVGGRNALFFPIFF